MKIMIMTTMKMTTTILRNVGDNDIDNIEAKYIRMRCSSNIRRISSVSLPPRPDRRSERFRARSEIRRRARTPVRFRSIDRIFELLKIFENSARPLSRYRDCSRDVEELVLDARGWTIRVEIRWTAEVAKRELRGRAPLSSAAHKVSE